MSQVGTKEHAGTQESVAMCMTKGCDWEWDVPDSQRYGLEGANRARVAALYHATSHSHTTEMWKRLVYDYER